MELKLCKGLEVGNCEALCTTKVVHCCNTIKTLKELKNRQEEGDGGAEDKMIVNI